MDLTDPSPVPSCPKGCAVQRLWCVFPVDPLEQGANSPPKKKKKKKNKEVPTSPTPPPTKKKQRYQRRKIATPISGVLHFHLRFDVPWGAHASHRLQRFLVVHCLGAHPHDGPQHGDLERDVWTDSRTLTLHSRFVTRFAHKLVCLLLVVLVFLGGGVLTGKQKEYCLPTRSSRPDFHFGSFWRFQQGTWSKPLQEDLTRHVSPSISIAFCAKVGQLFVRETLLGPPFH